ncbi:sialidase family protein, partial [Lysinibacillus xylanilyticus]|nr:glycoside hydrolase [Lysinibacillus xylanilyticus]
MAQYYYDKFTSIKNETYDYYESVAIPGTRIAISNVDVVQMLNPLIPDNLGAGTVINPTTAYNGISIDKTGKIGMEKPIVNRDLKETVFKTLYEFTTNYGSYGHRYCYMQFTGPGAGTYKVNMFADYEEQNPGHFYTVTIYKLTPVVIKTTYSKGALVQANIAAEDGTYPADGRHTDGYWYVKKGAVGPTPPGTVTPIITSLLRPTANAKFVYLDNGWLVAAPYIKDTNTALFVSKDNGVTWEQGYMLGIGGVKDTTICAVGNSVAWIVQKDAQLLYYLYNLETHTLTVTGAILATDAISQNGAGASMFYDKSTGILHLAFSVRTSIYPSNYNIRYMNCVAAQGNAWTNAKMLTNSTELNKDNYAPSIVVKGNKIWIAYSIVQGSVFSIGILYSTNNSATFNNAYPVSASVQLATAPKLIMDSNDRFHLIYLKTTTTNGVAQLATLWSDSGTAWQEPTGNFLNDNKCTSATITYDKTNGNLWAMGFSPATSNVYAFMSKDRGLSWESSTLVNTDSQYPQLLHDPEFRLSFGRNTGSPPPYIHETSDKGVLLAGAIVKNNPPSIAVLSPSDNQTLYENDTFNISGDAYDADKDQSVTSYYQINSDSKKVLTTNISQTQIMLSKQLKFKAGKLYDGESAITGTLAEGVAHALKVWAEDSEKASSTIVERSFYVVPNRAPLLTVDEVVPSGTIN